VGSDAAGCGSKAQSVSSRSPRQAPSQAGRKIERPVRSSRGAGGIVAVVSGGDSSASAHPRRSLPRPRSPLPLVGRPSRGGCLRSPREPEHVPKFLFFLSSRLVPREYRMNVEGGANQRIYGPTRLSDPTASYRRFVTRFFRVRPPR
jgi:hypothetical protein